MTARPDGRLRADAIDAAAAWTEEARWGLTSRRQVQFDAWLSADPAHPQALAAVDRVDDVLVAHAADDELLALRKAALTAGPEPLRWRLPAFRPMLVAASVALIGVLGALGWSEALWLRQQMQALGIVAEDVTRYATEIGERSTVTLPDGSTMTLNTASVADVAYTPAERRVRLVSGQAVFTVAHGRAAPFRVEAGDRVITATGTYFDVRLDNGTVRVALVEGGVRVAPLGQTGGDEVLKSGQVLIAAPAQPVTIRPDGAGQAVSWREGLTVFDETPLPYAVAEINRYTRHPIVVSGPLPEIYKVSGTFRTGEPQRFTDAMTELFPLIAERSADGSIVLKARP